MRLENWSIRWRGNRQCLGGNVYGHPEHKDGQPIVTSPINGNQGGRVQTRSGSDYELGAVDPEWERRFPGARDRFFAQQWIPDPAIPGRN